jgi:hypothetical protein
MNDTSTLTPESSRAASYLEGASFPADKSELIAHASLNGASEEVLEVLHRLPDRYYADLSKVIDEIGAGEEGQTE